MKSVITNATLDIFNQETGKSILEIKTPANTVAIKSKPTKDKLIPFKMKFDGCEQVQIFVTEETYTIMQGYKNTTQKTKDVTIPSLQSVNKNDLIPFTMDFDGYMNIQVFVTREAYQVMKDYEKRI